MHLQPDLVYHPDPIATQVGGVASTRSKGVPLYAQAAKANLLIESNVLDISGAGAHANAHGSLGPQPRENVPDETPPEPAVLLLRRNRHVANLGATFVFAQKQQLTYHTRGRGLLQQEEPATKHVAANLLLRIISQEQQLKNAHAVVVAFHLYYFKHLYRTPVSNLNCAALESEVRVAGKLQLQMKIYRCAPSGDNAEVTFTKS